MSTSAGTSAWCSRRQLASGGRHGELLSGLGRVAWRAWWRKFRGDISVPRLMDGGASPASRTSAPIALGGQRSGGHAARDAGAEVRWATEDLCSTPRHRSRSWSADRGRPPRAGSRDRQHARIVAARPALRDRDNRHDRRENRVDARPAARRRHVDHDLRRAGLAALSVAPPRSTRR